MLKRVLRNILTIALISSLCGFTMPIMVNATEIEKQNDINVEKNYSSSSSFNNSQNEIKNDNQGSNSTEGPNKENNSGQTGNNSENTTVSNNVSSGNNNTNSSNSVQNNIGTENNNNTNDKNTGNTSNNSTSGGSSNTSSNNNVGTNNNIKENNNNINNQNTVDTSNNNGAQDNIPNNNDDKTEQPVQTSSKPVYTKSNDANLKDLNVNVEGMTPEFNRNVTKYYLIVDLDVEKIDVTATPADSKSLVEITGNEELIEGENAITINVTAEDGTQKEYSIDVTKTKDIEKANASLKILNIEGYDISPNFKSNIYNYTLTINEAIENLNVTAEAEKEKANVQISGNTELKEGENLIEICVTAENGITQIKYKVKVFIDTEIVNVKEESKLPGIILLVILVVCASSIIIGIIIKHRTK